MHCTDEVVLMCGRLGDRVGVWSVTTRTSRLYPLQGQRPSSVALLFPPCLCVMYVVCVPSHLLIVHPWLASPSHL